MTEEREIANIKNLLKDAFNNIVNEHPKDYTYIKHAIPAAFDYYRMNRFNGLSSYDCDYAPYPQHELVVCRENDHSSEFKVYVNIRRRMKIKPFRLVYTYYKCLPKNAIDISEAKWKLLDIEQITL